MIRLQLFGGFHATRADGAEIPLTARKGEALLAYLALTPTQRQSRERLATLLWGDRFEEQARHSLRQTVLALRKVLDVGPPSTLITEGDFLQLNGAEIEVDALVFDQLVRDGTTASLSRAAELYNGELLDGLVTRATDFEEWLVAERTRYRDMAIGALTILMGHKSDRGDVNAALEIGQRLVEIDPANENAHRLIIQIYDASGRRSAALRQFQIYASTLRNEFDAEPDPQLAQLNAEIQARDQRRQSDMTDERPGTEPARARLRAADVEPGAQPQAKPSIVVIPFKDLSSNISQQGLASAVAEGIATALSMVPVLTVSTPGSTPAFMGQAQVDDLRNGGDGGRYILVGSVQGADERVRISARLTEASSGQLIWGDRYDRVLDDIFALQDEITLEIVASLEFKLTASEQEQISLSPGTRNLRAWLSVGQGVQQLQSLTRENVAKSRECFQRASSLDSDYASAWAGLAWTYFVEAWSGWTATPADTLKRAAELAEKALALDPGRPRTHSLLGIIRLLEGNHHAAVAMGERALELNPNGAEAAAFLALTLSYTGDVERSMSLAAYALDVSPYPAVWLHWILGRAYRLGGRLDDAITSLSSRFEKASTPLWPRVELAAAYVMAGRMDEAAAMASSITSLDPRFSTQRWVAMPAYSDPGVAIREAAILGKIGLPD